MSEKESNIFIGLGTNLGNKEENLKHAIEEIEKVAEVLVCSPIYETEPIGFANQPLVNSDRPPSVNRPMACSLRSGRSLGLLKFSTSVIFVPLVSLRPHQWKTSVFYNQVLEIRTALNPEALLVALKDIEKKLGRVPTIRNGPRSIDCDILYHKNRIVETETLVIPHPRAAERAFVLMPLQDIAPEFVDPVQKKTIHELVEKLPEEEKRKVRKLCKRG
ncbi:2-amino-4-hydroxy-6-hydroxymethyldihydropteridine diphosphokinase [Candidatus Woesearchaeota archaeon]|nr:2-amino-4-hydroxy-6-hydroxymethyldihydropteridine diphosphokinase [Candidatus Woesearchaeota archaeon]